MLHVRILTSAALVLPIIGQSLDLGSDLTQYYDQNVRMI